MNETSKTLKIWTPEEKAILEGKGIDIGCGPDPVTDMVRRFDIEDGDANRITEFVQDQFNFVYSSHCLEHMQDPPEALREWWKLVKVGGHIIFIVPDEDLYEQGVFPSRFNPDHKATFTISKARSWSPVSHNVLDLAGMLPGAKLISITLHDLAYDRSLMQHGPSSSPGRLLNFAFRVNNALKNRKICECSGLSLAQSKFRLCDQTLRPDTLAQIQCILKKEK